MAPALDVPTYARTALGLTTTNVGGTGLMTFQNGGTSLSAAMVTGSMAVVASALSYWTTLTNSGGVTADAYLNTPVGTNVLNFGPGAMPNLSAYENPDSVYGILQWTAVPTRDQPTTLDTNAPQQLFPNAGGPYPEMSRIDVGNAVASIEGTVALYYLINHGTFDVIDANHNGLVTAQEIQDFVNKADTIGMPEAGAMARLLGGTDRIPVTGFQPTAAGESPDQPDVLQRRFNFFDYAADGQLDGVISIDQLKMLVHTLLPSPDAFVVTDRVRGSANGYLLDPSKQRNWVALQYLTPSYSFAPARLVRRYRNVSPTRFGVNRGELPSTINGPQYTLFDHSTSANNSSSASSKGTGSQTNLATNTQTSAGSSSTGGTTGSTNTASTNPATGSTTNGSTTNGSTTTDYGQQAVDQAIRLIYNSPTLAGTQGQSSSSTSLPAAQKSSDTPSNPVPAASSVTPVTTASASSSETQTANTSSSKSAPADQAAVLRDRAQVLTQQINSGQLSGAAQQIATKRLGLLSRILGQG